MKHTNTALIESEALYNHVRKSDSYDAIKNNRIFYSLPFNYDNASDEALVSLYVNNRDDEAFNRIFKRYDDIIFGFAIKLIKNTQDAEEIKQDVFLILVAKLHTFKGNSKFSTWLYRVTINTCYKYLNDSAIRSRKEVNLYETLFRKPNSCLNWDKTPGDIALCNERVELILNAVKELTPSNREIFILKDIKGFSNAEVGELTGLSVSAVKSRVLRSRHAIKENISGYFTA